MASRRTDSPKIFSILAPGTQVEKAPRRQQVPPYPLGTCPSHSDPLSRGLTDTIPRTKALRRLPQDLARNPRELWTVSRCPASPGVPRQLHWRRTPGPSSMPPGATISVEIRPSRCIMDTPDQVRIGGGWLGHSEAVPQGNLPLEHRVPLPPPHTTDCPFSSQPPPACQTWERP